MSTTHDAVMPHAQTAHTSSVIVSAGDAIAPPPSGINAFDAIAIRSREALPAKALVIVADGHTVVPQLPAGVWGLQVIAADTAIDGGQLALFAALTLTVQPDARAHDGDVVVRLRTAATTPAGDDLVFMPISEVGSLRANKISCSRSPGLTPVKAMSTSRPGSSPDN